MRQDRGGDASFANPTPHRYLYVCWSNARLRCTSPKHKSWPNYGGRGIQMHHLWVDDYAAFKAYILTELGERPTPKHSLDRVNNDGTTNLVT